MGEWTAIVLAGHRPGETDFAEGLGVAAKALIPVGGEPMLARVVRALLAAPSVGRVIVLAQSADRLLSRAPAWLRNEARVTTAEAGDGISASIAAIAGEPAAPFPLLVTTADHALLTPDMVETFLTRTAGADVSFALVDRATVESAYPETRRTWLKFSDGHYTGANLFALANTSAHGALDFWARAERDRKKALKMLTFFGPTIFLRALTRTISLDAAAMKVGRALKLRLKAVRLPFAEAAIDVDKLSDLVLAERAAAARIGVGDTIAVGAR
jgi:GTP:adenosylcobinamide-phosphate guanylyltransferase